MTNNKTPGGNTMSSTTNTARRIALLSSSSLGLAAIASVASLGVTFAPTTAIAAVTCVATTTVTGNGTETVTIAGGTNNPGITCAYTGTTATVTTLAAVTVSTIAGGNGINLTGGAADAIIWTSTAAPSSFSAAVAGGSQTNGPVIDAQTGGNITLTTGNVTVNTSGTDGIFARSTNGGNVTLTTRDVGFGSAAGSTAIRAISNGGNISVTTTGQIGNNASNLTQATTNRDGIVVQTSGTGTVNLNVGGLTTGFGAGGAAVRVTNGTGDVNIAATGAIRGGETSSSTDAQLASGIVISSGGHVNVESSGIIMGAVNTTGVQAAAIVASGQTFTLTLTGGANSAPDEVQSYRASLGGYYNSDGSNGGETGLISLSDSSTNRRTGGHVDLSGVTGGTELNFNTRSRWMVTETSVMSGGTDVVNIDATSALVSAMQGPNVSVLLADVDQAIMRPGIVDFGAGEDIVNNSGRILIGSVYTSINYVGEGEDVPPVAVKRFGVRGELRLLNLEEFNNSGEIWLGPRFHREGGISENFVNLFITDQFHDDMFYMPGVTFHGNEGSIVFMDVDLNKSQSSCAPSTRDAEGYLPAADCIGLQGGAATGRTELRIYEQVPGDRGAYNPDGIVLVDLAGADPDLTDPGAFVISPDTPRYIDVGNGGIEKGVFAYILGFDADTQQFKLVGAPSSGAQQFPILATAANQLWQTATGGWFERRVQQRDIAHEGLGTGAWFNVTGTGVERDITTPIAIGSSEVVFDNSYEQNDVAISFGWDLLDYGSNAALGAMVGYAHSEVEFNDSDNSANLEGVHAGVYGGYGVGGFFVDGAVNLTMLSVHNDVPAMALEPEGTVLDTNATSLGGRVEAGWRWSFEGLSLEPLVGFSAVRTEFDDLRVPNADPDPNRPGVTVSLESAESRRASAGLRFSVQDLWSNLAPTNVSLTARAVNEFEGGSNVSVANIGPSYLGVDTLEGMFTQLTGSVAVANVARTVSGYLNIDAVKGDDYDSLGASVGVRLHW